MFSIRAVPRLFRRSPGELLELVRAQWLLLVAQWTLRTRPRGRLLRPATPDAASASPERLRRVARMAIAVDRAARLGLFRPTCLVRAIALEKLLHREHVNSATVRVGVLRDEAALLAHAWIELDGRVLGDSPANVRRFVPLPHFTAVQQ